MVSGVREVDEIGYHFAESGEGGIIGYVARTEDESGFFLVEVGELLLEMDMVVTRP